MLAETGKSSSPAWAAPILELLAHQRREQRWLAAMIGVSEAYLSRMLSGERPTKPERVKAMADALGVPVSWIRQGDPMTALMQAPINLQGYRPRRKPRLDAAQKLEALAYAEVYGVAKACRKYGVSPSTMCRWRAEP